MRWKWGEVGWKPQSGLLSDIRLLRWPSLLFPSPNKGKRIRLCSMWGCGQYNLKRFAKKREEDKNKSMQTVEQLTWARCWSLMLFWKTLSVCSEAFWSPNPSLANLLWMPKGPGFGSIPSKAILSMFDCCDKRERTVKTVSSQRETFY